MDCAAVQGEVIDGGEGTDTVRSSLTEAELVAAGVRLTSIESVITIPEYYAGDCTVGPYDEGAAVQPKLDLLWVHLSDPDDTYLTSNGLVYVDIDNTSADDVDYDLTWRLHVRGGEVTLEQSALQLDSGISTRVAFDLGDFIPAGVDPQTVPAELLVLPTSAQLRFEAHIRLRGKPEEISRAFSGPVWGHHENAEARLYREDLFHTTYNHGDLMAWRAGKVPDALPYKVVARIEATTPKEPTP